MERTSSEHDGGVTRRTPTGWAHHIDVGPRDLPAQHRVLMAPHEQFDILGRIGIRPGVGEGQARTLLMDLDERADRFSFLVRDRDAKFTTAFDTVFEAADITVLRTPSQTPNANAFAERWIFSARRECTDRQLIFSQRHLETGRVTLGADLYGQGLRAGDGWT